MSKPLSDPNPDSDRHPYPVEFFAEKHGLALRHAEVILYSNGPSRAKCDAAARAFLQAIAMRSKSKATRRLPEG